MCDEGKKVNECASEMWCNYEKADVCVYISSVWKNQSWEVVSQFTESFK